MRSSPCLTPVLLLCLLLPSCVSNPGAPPRVKEALTKEKFSVGEDILLHITARAPSGTLFRWVPPEEGLEEVRLEDHTIHFSERPWATYLKLNLVLRSFVPGEHTIPPLPVSYLLKKDALWQTAKTQPLTLTVEDLVDGDALELDIKDIKGPLKRRSVLAWILTCLLAAAAVAFGIRRWMEHRRSVPAPPDPAPGAHEIALRRIRDLVAKDYIRQGLEQKFYTEISLIIREYLEARFAIRAPEMTTEEFLERLRDTDTLDAPHKELLRDFLTHCDLVKFARYAPGASEIDAALNSARRLIEETKIKPEVTTDERADVGA